MMIRKISEQWSAFLIKKELKKEKAFKWRKKHSSKQVVAITSTLGKRELDKEKF